MPTESSAEDQNTWTTTSGPWQWTTGIYFKDDESIGGDKARPSFDVVMNPGFEDRVGQINAFFGGVETLVNSSELAAYGEVSYAFNEQFELLVGLRASNVKADIEGITQEVDDTAVSPKATLTYRPTDSLMTYATVSQGFRPGLVNTAAISEIARLAPFANAGAPAAVEQVAFLEARQTTEGDEVINYELGLKGTFADGTVRLTSALYYMDWKDTILNQAYSTLLTPGFGLNYNENVGSAISRGIEVEVDVLLTDALTLHAGGDYNDKAEIQTSAAGQFRDAAGNPIGVLKGNRLANAPKYSSNSYVDYQFLVADRYPASARLDWYVVAKSFNRTTNEQTTKGYSTVNGRVTMKSPDESGWRVALFGKNLNNAVIRYETNEVGTGFGLPRTIGVEVEWLM